MASLIIGKRNKNNSKEQRNSFLQFNHSLPPAFLSLHIPEDQPQHSSLMPNGLKENPPKGAPLKDTQYYQGLLNFGFSNHFMEFKPWSQLHPGTTRAYF